MKRKNIKIIKVKKFIDNRGKVIKMISKKDNHFSKFGEIYFSTINVGKIKAWRMHKKNTCNIFLLKGKVVLIILKNNKLKKIVLNENQNKLVVIPNNYWIGFKNIGKLEAIIANFMNNVHSELEVERINSNFFKKIDWKKL